MSVGGSGGGYFYGPFVSTQGFGNYTIVPAAGIGAYGAWSHLVAPIPTGRGRWIEILVWPAALGSIYTLQVGIGAAGAETLFQPSDGTGFYIDWFSAIKWPVPFRIFFPTSVGTGREFSLRCASVPGNGANLTGLIYLWN